VTEKYNPPLQVVGFIATRTTDPERGPMVRIRGDEAAYRLLQDGELVWVYGPRRHELATLVVDDTVPRGGVVLRDIAGVTVTEIVRLVKLDTDTPPRRQSFA
jgi:anaerobic selenocysteine-containing dehydrogenase